MHRFSVKRPNLPYKSELMVMASSKHLQLITIFNSTHPNKMASTTVEEIAKQIRAKDPASAVVLERYIAETDNLKNTVQAIVEDIGYCMQELDLRQGQSEGLRRCSTDLVRSVEEHTKVTDSAYERNFRPRFSCKVVDFKYVKATKKDGQEEETQIEFALQIPVAEYNESPHSLIPGQTKVYIMMKGEL
ncbi:hypothetical protein NCS52_00182100 [Fusarium sp. LHS14.1]|nr:hypothetical protein NCS52_00182100 [Fusarium sp. LHS14.1]